MEILPWKAANEIISLQKQMLAGILKLGELVQTQNDLLARQVAALEALTAKEAPKSRHR